MSKPTLVVAVAASLALSACADGKRLSEFLIPAELEEVDQGPQSAQTLRGKIDGEHGRAKFPQEATFFGVMNASASATNKSPGTEASQKHAKVYLRAGIALSNDLCRQFFRKLIHVQSTVNADRDLLSNVGALTALITGLAEVDSKIVGGIGGAFGFLEDTINSEQANFLVAAELSVVQDAIAKDRKLRADLLVAPAKTYDFYSARDALIAYDDTCSQGAIKRFVLETVATGKDIRLNRIKKKRDQLQDQTGQRVVEAAAVGISDLIEGGPILSNDDVLFLYAVLYRPSILTEEIRGALVQRLTEINVLNASGQLVLRGGSRASDLRDVLMRANTSGLLDAAVGEYVENTKKTLASAEEENARQQQDAQPPAPTPPAPAPTPSLPAPSPPNPG